MIELESWRKQDNSTPFGWLGWSCLWQYSTSWGSACCLYLLSRTIPQKWGTLQIPFFLYNFIRHFWIETWPTEAQRRQMPVKTFDNTIIKTDYGIDQYHRRWRLKNCADYFFCSFDLASSDQEKDEEKTDFQTLMWINDKFGLIWWSFLFANVNIFGH